MCVCVRVCVVSTLKSSQPNNNTIKINFLIWIKHFLENLKKLEKWCAKFIELLDE